MTKSELRKARKAAVEAGQDWRTIGQTTKAQKLQPRVKREHVADRETQHGRYIDCGPAAWDDR